MPHYYYYSSESYFNDHGMAMEQDIHSECTLLLFDKSRVPEGRVRDVVKKFNPQQSHSENGGVAEREQDPVYDATIVYGKEWSHSIEKSAAVQAVSSSSASSSAFASSSASYSSEETPMYEDVYNPRADYE